MTTTTGAVGPQLTDGRPLPRRLADPLRVLRFLLSWSLIINLLVAVAGFYAQNTDAFLIGGLSLPALAFIWRVLPNRTTDAFYLRSFRHDPKTAAIRQAVKNGLGREFRLSGIRDPSRRWSIILRVVVSTAFCFRYATTKYMSLEAGRDWLARLWRSLGDTRCAFIDLTELTTHVDTEIRLAYRCLGLGRTSSSATRPGISTSGGRSSPRSWGRSPRRRARSRSRPGAGRLGPSVGNSRGWSRGSPRHSPRERPGCGARDTPSSALR